MTTTKENTMTSPNSMTCTVCGAFYTAITGHRTAATINHMINAGELTIGEARAELATAYLDRESMENLAGWILARGDQGDDWKAGADVRLPDGQVVPYADEHNWTTRDGRWFRLEPTTFANAEIVFPAGSYDGGL